MLETFATATDDAATEDAKVILADKDMFNNAVQAHHDFHVNVIDAKEDQLATGEKTRLDGKMAEIRKGRGRETGSRSRKSQPRTRGSTRRRRRSSGTARKTREFVKSQTTVRLSCDTRHEVARAIFDRTRAIRPDSTPRGLGLGNRSRRERGCPRSVELRARGPSPRPPPRRFARASRPGGAVSSSSAGRGRTVRSSGPCRSSGRGPLRVRRAFAPARSPREAISLPALLPRERTSPPPSGNPAPCRFHSPPLLLTAALFRRSFSPSPSPPAASPSPPSPRAPPSASASRGGRFSARRRYPDSRSARPPGRTLHLRAPRGRGGLCSPRVRLVIRRLRVAEIR